MFQFPSLQYRERATSRNDGCVREKSRVGRPYYRLDRNPTYKVFGSFGHILTEKTHDDPSTLSAFDLNVKEDLGSDGFAAKLNAGQKSQVGERGSHNNM